MGRGGFLSISSLVYQLTVISAECYCYWMVSFRNQCRMATGWLCKLKASTSLYLFFSYVIFLCCVYVSCEAPAHSVQVSHVQWLCVLLKPDFCDGRLTMKVTCMRCLRVNLQLYRCPRSTWRTTFIWVMFFAAAEAVIITCISMLKYFYAVLLRKVIQPCCSNEAGSSFPLIRQIYGNSSLPPLL